MKPDEAARLLPTVRKHATGALMVNIGTHEQSETQFIRIVFPTGFIFLHSVREVIKTLQLWTQDDQEGVA